MVPIVADEARTFGMQTLFRQVGIYSALGQLYEPEDHDELLYYREARTGASWKKGITEAGALLLARRDLVLDARPADAAVLRLLLDVRLPARGRPGGRRPIRARGFLVGATAGRTTLAGEGLQHQDGSSHLIAATIPNCRAYDPCFGYELAAIVQHGARRMLEEHEDAFYYVTVANENYLHPPMPEGARRAS